MVVTIDPAEVGSPYREPPPSVKLIPGPNFDAEGFSLSDIWSELPYSDTPLYGDVDSMTGVEPAVGFNDLMAMGHRSQNLAIARVAGDISGAAALGTMVCSFCAPVLSPIGTAASGVSAMATYSATRSGTGALGSSSSTI